MIFSPPTSRKTALSTLAAGLLLVAFTACAHAQSTRFAFATPSEARAVLGVQDGYVRATSTLERSVVMDTTEVMDAERFAAAMQATALEWTEDERRPFGAVLARLERFLSGMKWKGPAGILMVKTSDRLMECFPHTRGNAIVIPPCAKSSTGRSASAPAPRSRCRKRWSACASPTPTPR